MTTEFNVFISLTPNCLSLRSHRTTEEKGRELDRLCAGFMKIRGFLAKPQPKLRKLIF
jgi:hypothetical protein